MVWWYELINKTQLNIYEISTRYESSAIGVSAYGLYWDLFLNGEILVVRSLYRNKK